MNFGKIVLTFAITDIAIIVAAMLTSVIVIAIVVAIATVPVADRRRR